MELHKNMCITNSKYTQINIGMELRCPVDNVGLARTHTANEA